MRWLARLAIFTLIVAIFLAYGYWRASSRAGISILVVDSSSKKAPGFVAELIVHDADGKELAKGQSDARFGSVEFVHPQYGSCVNENRSPPLPGEDYARWEKCIAEKFYWQAEWASKVKSFAIRFAQCSVDGIPLALRQRRDDWWLWWVPLPHVGGDPLTDFNAKILVNAAICEARAVGFYD